MPIILLQRQLGMSQVWALTGPFQGRMGRRAWRFVVTPYSTTSSTVSTAINVTALIQGQLRSGSNQITLAVTSVGDPVNCATKEATTA